MEAPWPQEPRCLSAAHKGHSRGDMGQERGDTDRVSVGRINSDPDAAKEIFYGILFLSAV